MQPVEAAGSECSAPGGGLSRLASLPAHLEFGAPHQSHRRSSSCSGLGLPLMQGTSRRNSREIGGLMVPASRMPVAMMWRIVVIFLAVNAFGLLYIISNDGNPEAHLPTVKLKFKAGATSNSRRTGPGRAVPPALKPHRVSSICSTELWEPLSKPPQSGPGPSDVVEAGLVVSHCKDDLSWLQGEIGVLHRCEGAAVRVTSIHVYTKCGTPPAKGTVPPGTVITELPNVGRCDHAYAHHLATNPPSRLKDVTVFVKDTYLANHRFGKMFEVLDMCTYVSTARQNGMGFGCGMAPMQGRERESDGTWRPANASAWHNAAVLSNFTMKVYNSFSTPNPGDAPFEARISPLGNWLYHSQVLPAKTVDRILRPGLIPVCYGGQFAVMRESLVMGGVSMQGWANFAKALERGNSIEEGHYAERMWATLLTPGPPWKNWQQIELGLLDAAPVVAPGSGKYWQIGALWDCQATRSHSYQRSAGQL